MLKEFIEQHKKTKQDEAKTTQHYVNKIKEELDQAGIGYRTSPMIYRGNIQSIQFTLTKPEFSSLAFEVLYPHIRFNNNRYFMDNIMFKEFLEDLARRLVL